MTSTVFVILMVTTILSSPPLLVTGVKATMHHDPESQLGPRPSPDKSTIEVVDLTSESGHSPSQPRSPATTELDQRSSQSKHSPSTSPGTSQHVRNSTQTQNYWPDAQIPEHWYCRRDDPCTAEELEEFRRRLNIEVGYEGDIVDPRERLQLYRACHLDSMIIEVPDFDATTNGGHQQPNGPSSSSSSSRNPNPEPGVAEPVDKPSPPFPNVEQPGVIEKSEEPAHGQADLQQRK